MATTVKPTQGCLFTTFKNTSGGTKKFSFLPPHGRELAADAELTVFGDPITAVSRANYRASRRNQEALAMALADNQLDVISTPCPIAYDASNLASYSLGVNAGSPVASAESASTWGSSSV